MKLADQDADRRTGRAPYRLVRRSLAVGPVLGALGALVAAGVGACVGVGLLRGSGDVRLFGSVALIIVGGAVAGIRPFRRKRWTSPLGTAAVLLLAAMLAAAQTSWFSSGMLPPSISLMLALLGFALIFTSRGGAVPAQFTAALAALLPGIYLLGYAYGPLDDPTGTGLAALFLSGSGLLSALGILCCLAHRGPMRHMLKPEPAGRLARRRIVLLIAAAIALDYFGIRLPVDPEATSFLIAAMAVIIILLMSEITDYSARASLLKRQPWHHPPVTKRPDELDAAIARREFFLLYQPQIDLSSNRVVGVEALVRWDAPGLGLISPTKFIPEAEESGAILPLGLWILEEACSRGVSWRGTALDGIDISVNVSPRQIREPGFVADVLAILERTGFPARHLVLEITESALVRRGEPGFDALWALHAAGIAISIDDFGTGYSCLAYLRELPVRQLKIDRSFVRDLPGDAEAEVIARTIVGMGRSLRLDIVAEGIETEPQADFFKGIWCNLAQGYFYAHPLNSSVLLIWAERWKATGAVTAGFSLNGQADDVMRMSYRSAPL